MIRKRTWVGRLSFLILAAVSSLAWGEERGGLQWVYTAPEKILFAPTISTRGVSYIATDDERIRAISRSGRQLWAVDPGGKPTTGFALQGGLLLFGTSQSDLVAYGTNGQRVWRRKLDDILLSPPAVAANGTIYAATRKGTLYAVNLSGRILWTYSTGDDVVFSPAVALSGRIYVASTRNFFGFEPSGRPAWIWALALPPGSQMALDAEDGLCYLDATGVIHHLDSHGKETWSATSSTTAGPPVASQDLAFVCEGTIVGPQTGFSISGAVKDGAGDPIPGVTLTAATATTLSESSSKALTGSDGKFKIPGLPKGTYTLTPSLTGYTFYPILLNVVVKDADVPGQNFVGTATSLTGGAPSGSGRPGALAPSAPSTEVQSKTTAFGVADGSLAWNVDFGSPYAPALVYGGGVLVPSSDYNLYLFESDGTLAKAIPLDQAPHDVTLVALDSGNRIYVVGGDRFLFAIGTVLQPNPSAPWGQLGAGPRRLSRREAPSAQATP